MANHRAPDPPGLRARLAWALTRIAHHILDLPRLYQETTNRERTRLVESAIFVAGALWLALAEGGFWWLGVVFFAVHALSELEDIYAAMAWRTRVERILEQEPRGAPKVANVRCGRGYSHRFLYGPNGWEEAGPAVALPAQPQEAVT